jgi:hypothetical protein
MIPTLTVTRYITPLREGGSLPAVVQASDGQLYVMKFTGAGQGARALVAELIAGEMGRALGLAVPPIVLLELDPAMGRTEGDPEILALLQASAGLNLGMAFLPMAFAFSPLLEPAPDSALASAVVWFDAYISNVDRTVRNTNMLLWQDKLWLIDHGAALFFHHAADWLESYAARSRSPFLPIKDHVLLRWAGDLDAIDAGLRSRLSRDVIEQAVAAVPDAWLNGRATTAPADQQRAAYVDYLTRRLDASPVFVEEALLARQKLL